MVYLIVSFPSEINDDILLYIGDFNFAVYVKRFWVASRLYSWDKNIPENVLMNIVKYLTFQKNLVMCIASEKGYYKLVEKLLLDPHVDPSFNMNAAIRLASRNGKFDIVKLLLSDSRVDPSDKDNEAIR